MSTIQTINRTLADVFVGSCLVTLLALVGVTRSLAPPLAATPVSVTVIGAAAAPLVQTTIYSADWCGPCKTYLKELLEKMPADGWLLRSATDADAARAHIVIEKREQQREAVRPAIDQIPCTVLRRSGVEVKRFYGRVSADDLAKAINKAAE